MLKDPLGRFVPFIIVGGRIAGPILGGVTNAAAYIATQAIIDEEITCGGMQVKHTIYTFHSSNSCVVAWL